MIIYIYNASKWSIEFWQADRLENSQCLCVFLLPTPRAWFFFFTHATPYPPAPYQPMAEPNWQYAVFHGGVGGLALPHPEPALRGLLPAGDAGVAPRGVIYKWFHSLFHANFYSDSNFVCIYLSKFLKIFMHQFILGAVIFSNTVTLDPPVFYNHPTNVYTHMPYPLILPSKCHTVYPFCAMGLRFV
jgi:hypothetical protein